MLSTILRRSPPLELSVPKVDNPFVEPVRSDDD